MIYVDWASDTSRDPAVSVPPTADPISISALGTFNFDCDNELPAFATGKSVLELKNNAGNALDVDWYSAKHNVLTIYYCFYVTHQLMKAARQWASASPVDAGEKSKFIKQKDLILNRLSNQVFRLNAFMGLVLNEIEEVRVRYRPNGFWCSVPGVREAIGRKRAPLRTAGQ